MMQRYYCLAILLFASFSQAQVTLTPGVRFGLNISTITETDGDQATDFYAGGFLNIKFNEHYSLQPEISYSRQGADHVEIDYYDYDTSTSFDGFQDVNINYVSLGIINKFTLVEGFHILLGPSLDIMAGDNLYLKGSQIDVALTTGIGYTFPMGLSVEARFKGGVGDVLDNNYYDYGDGFLFGGINNNVLFQLGLTYGFTLKSKSKK